MTLTSIDIADNEEEGITATAAGKGDAIPFLASSRSLVVDAESSFSQAERCFLENTELLNELSNCMHGIDINCLRMFALRMRRDLRNRIHHLSSANNILSTSRQMLN